MPEIALRSVFEMCICLLDSRGGGAEMWVLLSRGLPPGGSVDDIPDPDKLSEYGQLTPGHNGGRGHHHGNFCSHCSPVWAALMLEMLERPDQVSSSGCR